MSKSNETINNMSENQVFTPRCGRINGNLKISQSKKSFKSMNNGNYSDDLISDSELVLSTTIDGSTSTSINLTSGSSTTLSCLRNDDYSLTGSSESSQNDYLKMRPDDSETISSLSESSISSSEIIKEQQMPSKYSSEKNSLVKRTKISLKDSHKKNPGKVFEQTKSASYLQTTLTSSGSKKHSTNQKVYYTSSTNRINSINKTSNVQERRDESKSFTAQLSKSTIGQKKLNDHTNEEKVNVKPSISRVSTTNSQSAPTSLPCSAKSYFDRLNMLKKDLQSKSNGDFLLDFPETSIPVPVPKAGKSKNENEGPEILYQTIGFMRTPMTAPIPKCTKPIIPILKKKSQFDRIKTVNSTLKSNKSSHIEVSGDQSEVKGIKSSISFGDRSMESSNHFNRSKYNTPTITSSNIYTTEDIVPVIDSKSQVSTQGNYKRPSINRKPQAQKAPPTDSALMENITSQARQIEYLQNKLEVAYKAIAQRDRYIELSNKKYTETETKLNVLVKNLQESIDLQAKEKAKAEQAIKEKELCQKEKKEIEMCMIKPSCRDMSIQIGPSMNSLKNNTTQSFKYTKTSQIGVQTRKIKAATVRNTATNTYPLTAFSSTSESSQISEEGHLQLFQNKIKNNLGTPDARTLAQNILNKFTKDLLVPTGKKSEKSTMLMAKNEKIEKVRRMMKTTCVGAANIALVCTASLLVVKSVKNVLSMVE